jgi:Methyltransferase domain
MESQKVFRAHRNAHVEQRKMWRILQIHLRRKRFTFFKALIAPLARPLCILDVGGTQTFWEDMHFQDEGVKIIVYNLTKAEVSYPGIISMAGDACNMGDFYDQQFDVVFSNSVIEHVGTYQQQCIMAREVQRVGKRYCIQTPNRYFPIEPHVLLPFFQFLPSQLQIFILSHFRSPWGWRLKDRTEATQYVQAIRLLNAKELHALFPNAQIYREKILGLTKSFFIYEGWC